MAKNDEKDMATVIDLLIEKIAALQAGGGGITTEQLDKLLEKTAGTTADAFRQALIPENKVPTGISAYNKTGKAAKKFVTPTGEPRTVYFCRAKQTTDMLTPEEVEAFNKITSDCSARDGRWWARLGRNGSEHVLEVYCAEAVERDRARDLPPLVNILYELAEGPQAVDLVALRAQLDELQKKLVSVEAVG